MFHYARVLLASCKVHTLTLNNAKKSHTVMQRSERWEQVKWTQCSESMCFNEGFTSREQYRLNKSNICQVLLCFVCFALLCSELRLLCSQCSALPFEAQWLKHTEEYFSLQRNEPKDFSENEFLSQEAISPRWWMANSQWGETSKYSRSFRDWNGSKLN